MAINDAVETSRDGVARTNPGSYETSAAESKFAIIEEQLDVQVEEHVTGIVRLEKTVHTYDAVVNEELLSDSLTVEHVPINRVLDQPVMIRQEGDVTIYPVMEEVIVVSKQLVLKEEVRVTRRTHAFKHQETVPLRKEELRVERIDPNTAS